MNRDLGWGDVADYLLERDKTYGTTEFNDLAVFYPQTEDTAAAPDLTKFGEIMESLDIVPG